VLIKLVGWSLMSLFSTNMAISEMRLIKLSMHHRNYCFAYRRQDKLTFPLCATFQLQQQVIAHLLSMCYVGPRGVFNITNMNTPWQPRNHIFSRLNNTQRL